MNLTKNWLTYIFLTLKQLYEKPIHLLFLGCDQKCLYHKIHIFYIFLFLFNFISFPPTQPVTVRPTHLSYKIPSYYIPYSKYTRYFHDMSPFLILCFQVKVSWPVHPNHITIILSPFPNLLLKTKSVNQCSVTHHQAQAKANMHNMLSQSIIICILMRWALVLFPGLVWSLVSAIILYHHHKLPKKKLLSWTVSYCVTTLKQGTTWPSQKVLFRTVELVILNMMY